MLRLHVIFDEFLILLCNISNMQIECIEMKNWDNIDNISRTIATMHLYVISESNVIFTLCVIQIYDPFLFTPSVINFISNLFIDL